jgi:hypothetical protein
MCTEIFLDDVDACVDRMLAGKLKGRLLVNMQC